jgi:hypothetical protein
MASERQHVSQGHVSLLSLYSCAVTGTIWLSGVTGPFHSVGDGCGMRVVKQVGSMDFLIRRQIIVATP